ncbi:hypothetical protein C6Y45_07295 [Alkalicoccus saliphilus]|uniref:DUF4181 domain-containing protein n=2 Tax=Alkalicoccus saliphilus TaxID=200989 RepID=A0A2T4U706_9BACI|nr:hypothetical protein C6Y45_07295 [Alkalicoccus saliphilus]
MSIIALGSTWKVDIYRRVCTGSCSFLLGSQLFLARSGKKRERVWDTKGRWIEGARLGVLLIMILFFLTIFWDTGTLQSLWFWATLLIIIFSSQALVQWIYLSDKREALVSVYTVIFGIIWLAFQHVIF